MSLPFSFLLLHSANYDIHYMLLNIYFMMVKYIIIPNCSGSFKKTYSNMVNEHVLLIQYGKISLKLLISRIHGVFLSTGL